MVTTFGDVKELEQRWKEKPNEVSASEVGRLRVDLHTALAEEQDLKYVLQVQDLRDDVPLGEKAEKLYRELRGFLVQCRCL